MNNSSYFVLRALATASSLALAAEGAFAQSETSAQVRPIDQSGAETSNTGLQDIVVTAQRREQRLQDVPIAVSSISQASLSAAGATDTQTLTNAVPSLVIASRGTQAAPFIRGIGALLGNPNNESSVAVYQDGVYQPAPYGNFFDFYDIERVEVLKGPQGTLFGRNATGGVIQVITKDPSDELSGKFSAGYGNYDTLRLAGVLSGAIVPDVKFSVSGLYNDQNKGWGNAVSLGRRLEGQKDIGGRFKLVLTPGDATTIKLQADYYRSKGENANPQVPPGFRDLDGQPYAGDFNTRSVIPQFNDVRSYGFSGTIDHDFGAVRARSITAYRNIHQKWLTDQDLAATNIVFADINNSAKMFSQEFQLFSAPHSKLDWLVGAYYFRYDAGFAPLDISGLAFAGGPFSSFQSYNSSISKSIAVFGQATYPITDDTNLTLGIRNSWDEADGDMISAADNSLALGQLFFGPRYQPHLSYSKLTWRASLDHRFSPDVMVYASVNRGMKSGGFNISTFTSANNAYKPEQLTAYEIGFKSDLAGRTLRLNGSVFYYDFKDIQFQKVVGGAGFILNAPSAKNYGMELELEARPVERLTLTANAAYLHTRIGDFPGAPNSKPQPNGTPDSGDPLFNAKGNRLPFAPKFVGNIGVVYSIPTSFGNVEASANYYYNAGFPTELDNYRFIKHYGLLNGSIEWSDPSDTYSVRIWGKNITNKYYYSGLQAISGTADYATPAPPRTFGATLGVKFGK